MRTTYLSPLITLTVLLYFLVTGAHMAFASADTTYILNGYTLDSQVDINAARQPDDDLKIIRPYSEWSNQFTDYPCGYSIRYPKNMSVDVSLSAVRTIFADETTQIEIYYDNFNDTISNARDYIYYGNRFANNTKYHEIQSNETFYVNGLKTHLLKWTRRKLSRVDNDKNFYACAEIIKNSCEVYTIFIKSSQPINFEMDIIRSFTLINKQGLARTTKRYTPSKTMLNTETKIFYNKYFADSSTLKWGVFEPSAPETFQYLTPLENTMDYSFNFLIRYHTLEENLPERGLNKAYENKKYVELTLQTILQTEQANALQANGRTQDNAGIVYDILDGQYDDYLREYAQKLKTFGHPVLFRLNNEMNGDWCWYSAYYTGKDTELYQALWRYIHKVFDDNGVDNVLWVWNPHDVSRPEFKWNHYLMYYPGDEYVDIIGITGYNTGTYFRGESWREFNDIYTPLYTEYINLFDKPFMITEFGSNSVGGNKAVWINRMFDQIAKFDRIKVAIWWSGVDYDSNGQPGRIYLIDEDEEVIKTFRERLKAFKN